MPLVDIRRLRKLEEANAKLKKLVANLSLDMSNVRLRARPEQRIGSVLLIMLLM